MSYQRRRFNQSILPKVAPEKGEREYRQLKRKIKPRNKEELIKKLKAQEEAERKKRMEEENQRLLSTSKTSSSFVYIDGVQVTYNDWIDYEWCRWRDITPMTDIVRVKHISGLDEEKIVAINKNHENLMSVYGDLQETFSKNFQRT